MQLFAPGTPASQFHNYSTKRMAWQWAETLGEIRGTLADIRGTAK